MPSDSLGNLYVPHSPREQRSESLKVVRVFTPQEQLYRSPVGEAIKDAEGWIKRDPYTHQREDKKCDEELGISHGGLTKRAVVRPSFSVCCNRRN